MAASQAIERDEIVALARELSRRELAPLAPALDERRPGALEQAWAHLVEAGFDRALLPPELDGAGLEVGVLLSCLEELGAGEAGVALLALLSNLALAGLPPERTARIEAGERWALVPTPPAPVATPARVERHARPDDHPALTGTLSPALGALGATGVLLALDGEGPALLALDSGDPGLRFEACEDQLGLRAAAAARITLREVAAATGPEGGMTAAASLVLLRAGCAAIARGVARHAHELAAAYACTRLQGGVAIVEHDAVRRMLAAMEVGRATVPTPAGVGLDEPATLIAKVAAAEAAVATATDAVQVLGGSGYMRETGAEKLMRDAKYLQLWPEPPWVAEEAIVAATLEAA
ncbi:MAG: acyl-CoA dehydrogenase family protein [Solirubrobacterales bacterium]